MLILGCQYTYVIQCGIHVYVYSCASAVQCMHVHTYVVRTRTYVRTRVRTCIADGACAAHARPAGRPDRRNSQLIACNCIHMT